jgi:hypothetical protein
LLGTRHGPALSSCKSMGRHCADNNARAQRYLFSDRFQISGDHGTQLLRAIRLRENHSDEKITHREVGWSPLRNHPVYVRGGQVSDWEESQVLAALAKRNKGFTGEYVKPTTTRTHQDVFAASGSRNTTSVTINEAEKNVMTNVSFSPVVQTTHGVHTRAAQAHEGGSLTDTSPGQTNAKKCIQVGRDTYAVTSQPGTSYTSQDYDSLSVIDSSSPGTPKRKSVRRLKPHRHNNRHSRADVRAMDSFSCGSKL